MNPRLTARLAARLAGRSMLCALAFGTAPFALPSGTAHAAAPSTCADVNAGHADIGTTTISSNWSSASGFTLEPGETVYINATTSAEPVAIEVSSLMMNSSTSIGVGSARFPISNSTNVSVYIQVSVNFANSTHGSTDISLEFGCLGASSGGGLNSGIPVDSQNLARAQRFASQAAATTSAMAVTNAVDDGISSSFGEGEVVSVSAGSVTMNFAEGIAARQNAGEGRKAFKALGFDESSPASESPASARVERTWNIWTNIRGSMLSGNDGQDGNQLNGTAGAGYRILPNVVAGVLVGAETFDYSYDSIDAIVSGSGGTLGGYAGWRITPAIRLDAMAAWSDLTYDLKAGSADGKFDATRIIAGGGISGTYRTGALTLTPEARAYAAFEDQSGYTDSLGTVHGSNDFYTGRTSAGGKASWNFQMTENISLVPYAGLYADWLFSGNGDEDTSGSTDSLIGDGWSARTSAGATLQSVNGASFKLGGEVSGIGAGTQIWSASGRFSLSF